MKNQQAVAYENESNKDSELDSDWNLSELPDAEIFSLNRTQAISDELQRALQQWVRKLHP